MRCPGEWIPVIAGFLICNLAVAEETGARPVSSLKVDLEAVVEVGKVVPVDGISTAGQPDEMAFRVFADNGYVAVIDLRTAEEDRGLDEPAVIDRLGMEYVQLPIGEDDITFDKARELGDLLDDYEGPVLVHCASANRVGALLALMMVDDGADTELAIEMGKAAGMTRLEPAVREILDAR